MADTKTENEPSIEEILESIRQIISEDDAPAAEAVPAAAPVQAVAAPAPVAPPPPPPAPAKEEPVLELTDKVEPAMPPSDLDLSVSAPAASGGGLISDTATDASAAAMARLLAGNVAVENDVPGRVGQVTLEDMTKELLRPLVKTWLDQNLPGIIEKMVQKEIERISRKAGGV